MPAVVISVAAVHARGVLHDDLSPWKGAGFGMFSTVDAGGRRKIELRVRWRNEWCRVANPDDAIQHALIVARNYPSHSNLVKLATLVWDRTWGKPRTHEVSDPLIEQRVLADSLATPFITRHDLLVADRVWVVRGEDRKAEAITSRAQAVRVTVRRLEYSIASRRSRMRDIRVVEFAAGSNEWAAEAR